MTAIIEFLAEFCASIVNIITYIIGMIKDMIQLVVMLGQTATALPAALFAIVPRPAVSIGMLVLAVAVAYKVMGREG